MTDSTTVPAATPSAVSVAQAPASSPAATVEVKPTRQEAKPRTPEQIEAELAAARSRLVNDLAEFKQQATPAAIAAGPVNKVRGVFVDEFGGVRPERVAMAVGGVVGLLVVRRGMKRMATRRLMRSLGDVAWVPMPVDAIPEELARVARRGAPTA